MHLSCYTELLWDRMDLEKSIREGSCQKPVSCLSGRLPRGVFKSQSGNLPVWKVDQERNRTICKDSDRNGLSPASHEPCRMQRKSGRTEEAKRQLDMSSCGKRSLLPEKSSPVSLAHASEEFRIKHFEFHSKPAKSMGITLLFSVPWTESFQNKQGTET